MQALAQVVAERMGGRFAYDELEARYAAAAAERKRAAGSLVVGVGQLRVGLARHRALLFKALADAVKLPCRLLRGPVHLGAPVLASGAGLCCCVRGELCRTPAGGREHTGGAKRWRSPACCCAGCCRGLSSCTRRNVVEARDMRAAVQEFSQLRLLDIALRAHLLCRPAHLYLTLLARMAACGASMTRPAPVQGRTGSRARWRRCWCAARAARASCWWSW